MSSDSSTPHASPSGPATMSPNSLPTPPSASGDDTKPFSCILCKQRKIKCDKHYPCNNCTKARVQCIFRAPAPPRRGKRKPADVNLLARLKKYEDLLQGLGVSIDKLRIDDGAPKSQPQRPLDDGPAGEPEEPAKPERGKLITSGEGKSVYLEDNLWTSLSDELRDPLDFLGASSDEEDVEDPNVPVDRAAYDVNSASNQLVFGLGTISPSLRIPHPPLTHVMKLWEYFQANFDPLCKILHIPSTQATFLEALQDPDNMPKNTRALMYAMYCGALVSMSDAECLSNFGEDRLSMVTRFKLAAQQSLIRAGLLKSSDIAIVQAFTIYLLSVRMSHDPRTLWMLTGINGRLAQRIGLHRDGTHLGLPPFETEQRRRLWWQVLILDTHASILSGSGHSILSQSWDTKPPLNVNDADIWPDMTELPQEREGPTEMFFCLLRHEFGRYFRAVKMGPGSSMGVSSMSTEEKNAAIAEAEQRIENNFLRYCDFSSNLHTLSNGVGRSAIASMKLMAHHPRHRADKGAGMTEAEKEDMFRQSLKIVEYDSMCYSIDKLEGFRWHVSAYFQYNAFVYMLTELCRRTSGEDVERGWRQVTAALDNHPEMMTQRPLQVAVGKLVCKAWNVRVGELIRIGQQPVPPHCVAVLLSQRANSDKAGISPVTTSSTETLTPPMREPLTFGPSGTWPGFETDVLADPIFTYEEMNTETTPMDWAAWDNLLQDSQMPWMGDLLYNGPDASLQ